MRLLQYKTQIKILKFEKFLMLRLGEKDIAIMMNENFPNRSSLFCHAKIQLTSQYSKSSIINAVMTCAK